MIVGALGALLSIAFWGSWGGFGGYRRRSAVDGTGGTVVRDREVY